MKKKLLILLLIVVVGCVSVRVITGEGNSTERNPQKTGIDSNIIKNDTTKNN